MVIFGKKDLDWKLRIENDFRYTKDVMTRKNNIAYTNIRCQAVANEVRKRLNKIYIWTWGDFNMHSLQKGRRGYINWM